jgi:predicted MFS family arabinose efflux permease
VPTVTGGADDAAAGTTHTSRTGWRIVAALAVSQTVGYGVLSYTFAVLLTPMQQALDTGPVAVTGALTASLLAAALTAVPVGRWLDRHGGRALMTTGSVLATLLVVAWSRVETVAQLYAVWIGIGIVSAAVLYETALAVVVTWFPQQRRATALLAVTVVAGFASSIFLPLTGALVEAYGWRAAVLILAVIHGAVTVPLHLLVRRPPRAEPIRGGRGRGNPTAVRTALRDRGYWLLTIVFVTHTAGVAIISVHLVAYLRDLGHPATFAASIAGLLGVLSVTGRLVSTGARRRFAAHHVTAVVFAVQAAGAALLVLAARNTVGAVAAVLAFGLGFGVATIARPTILADRYGTTGYATIAAVLAVPLTIAKAAAPLGASLIRQNTGSYATVGLTVAAACLIAAVGLLILPPPPGGARGPAPAQPSPPHTSAKMPTAEAHVKGRQRHQPAPP